MKTKVLLFLSLLLQISSPILSKGLPLPTITTLPAPTHFDPADKDIVASVLKVPVYKDSENENQYYYTPPFRLYQYDQGAASMLINIPKSDNVYSAQDKLSKLVLQKMPEERFREDWVVNRKYKDLEYVDERIRSVEIRLQEEILTLEKKIAELEEKHTAAIDKGNATLIVAIEELIAKKSLRIEQIKRKDDTELITLAKERSQMAKEIADIYEVHNREYMSWQFTQITLPLASAGIPVDATRFSTFDALKAELETVVGRLKRSYGGLLTINVYTGFTEKELGDLAYYKQKYMPQLKISLLDAKDLRFTPLTQLQNGSKGTEEISMFKDVKGEGGYQGATINFDLTVDGAYSLSQSLGAFNPPIGINAQIMHQAKPFKADLSCDFSRVDLMKGRTDVRDGWIFWDDDITHQFSQNGSDGGACKLEMLEGDLDSAILAAMTELKTRLEQNNVRETQLSAGEAKKYYDSVLRDVDGHRRNFEHDAGWAQHLAKLDDRELAIETLAHAANFHWHTSVQDIEKLKKLSFSSRIYLNGYKEIRTGVPTSLCMYYNPQKHSYDRCTETQENEALSYTQARQQASSSPACQSSTTASECGRKRAELAEELRPQLGRRATDNLSGGRELGRTYR